MTLSRDWYIRTDKRNIQQTFGDIDTTPLSLKEKWRQNYKKYILWMVEAAVVLALIVLAFPVMFPKDTADYTVTLVTEAAVDEEAQNVLAAALEKHGTDRNGDGKVQVQVRALVVAATEDGQRNVALEQLVTSFKTEQYTLFAMEPAVYSRYVDAYAADGVSLFADIPWETGTYNNLWQQTESDTLPALLWGVRTLSEKTADQQAHLRLLEAYIVSEML